MKKDYSMEYREKKKIILALKDAFNQYQLNDFSFFILNENGYMNSYTCTDIFSVEKAVVVIGVYYKNKYLLSLELYDKSFYGLEFNLFICVKEGFIKNLEFKKLQLNLLIEKYKNTSFFFAYKERKEIKAIIKEKELFLLNELSLLQNIMNLSISFFNLYFKEDSKILNAINSNISYFINFMIKEPTFKFLNKNLYTKELDFIIDLLEDESLNIECLESLMIHNHIKNKEEVFILKEIDKKFFYKKFNNHLFLNELIHIFDKIKKSEKYYSESNIMKYERYVKEGIFIPKSLIINFDEINKLAQISIEEEKEVTEDVSQDLYSLFVKENKLEKIINSFFQLSYNNYYFYNQNIKSFRTTVLKRIKEDNKELTLKFKENNEVIISYIDLTFSKSIDLFKLNLKEKKIYRIYVDLDRDYLFDYQKIIFLIDYLEKIIFKKLLSSFKIEDDKKLSLYINPYDDKNKYINILNLK